MRSLGIVIFFFFNDTATTEIYTLSLHDALPISARGASRIGRGTRGSSVFTPRSAALGSLPQAGLSLSNRLKTSLLASVRSEEHTSELQSQSKLVCRLLLEKKNCRIKQCLPDVPP